MSSFVRTSALASVVVATACGHARVPVTPARDGVTLAVLPAESDRFPSVARAITDSLASAKVVGVDRTQMSKVSLEVVQLSIECVEDTVSCYVQVGKSLAANRLLFAQLAPGAKKQVRVSVTLFDVDAKAPHTAERMFKNEKDATKGVADLVAEATR